MTLASLKDTKLVGDDGRVWFVVQIHPNKPALFAISALPKYGITQGAEYVSGEEPTTSFEQSLHSAVKSAIRSAAS